LFGKLLSNIKLTALWGSKTKKMKRNTLIVIALLFAFASFAQQGNYNKYPFKTAIVEYKISGNTNGTKTTYIDQHGLKEASYTQSKTKMMGMETIENTASILIADKVYSIDFEKNTATTLKNPYLEMFANADGDYIKLGEQALTSLGYRKTGQGTVLGKSCDIWEGMNKAWVWKGLMLKVETKLMGMAFTEEATSVKIDVSVPASKFDIPDNIKVQEMSQGYQDMMGGFNEDEDDYDEGSDQEDMTEKLEKLRGLTYDQFVEMSRNGDPEITDAEIKESWNMFQMLLKSKK
jgi:hypothetical protein